VIHPTSGPSRATATRAPGSNPHRMVRCLATASLLLVAACTASSEAVRPPDDQLFFPTGITVTPDESELFVISANSELRYDSGTVSAIHLRAIDRVLEGWLQDRTIPSGCERDPSFSETIVCDERAFLLRDAGVRIGNFAASLAVQDLGEGNARLIVPVRGDPSITFIDWNATTGVLDCGDGEGFPLCTDQHRLTHFFGDLDLPQIADEPFNVFVDSVGQWAVVTHLTSGTATLVDLEGAPVLSDALTGVFNPDPLQRVGSVAVAGRRPGAAEDDLVYVGSSSDNRVQTFAIARDTTGRAVLFPSDYFFLDRVGAQAGGSQDTRAAAFGAGGDRGYFLNREPPSVAIVDTSIDNTGFPRNVVIGGTDVCREASAMVLGDAGEGERIFVTCFQDGELYVIDPANPGEVEATAVIGRGPFAAAIAPNRHRLYITNFFDDSIAVVDLTPGAPTQYRVVLRIGVPPV